jgi:hypothetical protein
MLNSRDKLKMTGNYPVAELVEANIAGTPAITNEAV